MALYVALREGLAAHILSRLCKDLSVDNSPGVNELSFPSCLLV